MEYIADIVKFLLVLVATKAMVIGSDFSFYHWYKYKSKYITWYCKRQTYEEFLKEKLYEEVISSKEEIGLIVNPEVEGFFNNTNLVKLLSNVSNDHLNEIKNNTVWLQIVVSMYKKVLVYSCLGKISPYYEQADSIISLYNRLLMIPGK